MIYKNDNDNNSNNNNDNNNNNNNNDNNNNNNGHISIKIINFVKTETTWDLFIYLYICLFISSLIKIIKLNFVHELKELLISSFVYLNFKL